MCVFTSEKVAMPKRQRVEEDDEEELKWQLDAAKSVLNEDLDAAASVISSNDAFAEVMLDDEDDASPAERAKIKIDTLLRVAEAVRKRRLDAVAGSDQRYEDV